jgi:hypothetical protein
MIKPECLAALPLSATAACGRTTWDTPTPYAPREIHSLNIQQFVDEVRKAIGGQLVIDGELILRVYRGQ